MLMQRTWSRRELTILGQKVKPLKIRNGQFSSTILNFHKDKTPQPKQNKIFSICQILNMSKLKTFYFIMSQSKSMNPIFENRSFIIFTTQSDFVYFLCENIMSARTNDSEF